VAAKICSLPLLIFDMIGALTAVDDKLELLRMRKAFFQTIDLDYKTFSRADDDLEYLTMVPCDIMLTDIIMPVMNGFELAKRS